MKIIIFGKNGQLGFAFNNLLANNPDYQLIGLDSRQCNLAKKAEIIKALTLYQPEVIINAAAYTDVNKAESEIELAMAINGSALQTIGEYAWTNNVLVMHYSTDYVFDGEKNSHYYENDNTAPLNIYGKSKLIGEENLIKSGARYLIFRTSWVLSARGNNFAASILKFAHERDNMKIICDQFGAPTTAEMLSEISKNILNKYRDKEDKKLFPYGLYHLTASGYTTWYNYALYVIDYATEKKNLKLKLRRENISPIKAIEYPTPAKRPSNSRLNCDLLKNTFNLQIPNWQDGVEEVLRVRC